MTKRQLIDYLSQYRDDDKISLEEVTFAYAREAVELIQTPYPLDDKEGCGYCGKDHPNDACPEVKS